jgi:hypothetical protein
VKIRKGLKQIEGLLAQICLSPQSDPVNRRSSVIHVPSGTCKKLRDLGADPAFLEFYRLQDGFEWNGEFQCQQKRFKHVLIDI